MPSIRSTRGNGRAAVRKGKNVPENQHLVRSTVMGDRGQVVIPKEIRDRAGLAPGSQLMVMHHQVNGPVVLLPMDQMRDFMEQMKKQMKETLS